MKLQSLLYSGAALSAAGLLSASLSAAWAADSACPGLPALSVYAYACSETSNFGDGVAIQISNGKGTVSTSGLTGINTAPLGSGTAAQAFQNGQFGLNGTSLATTESEPLSKPDGASGSSTASAGMGNASNASFSAIPFANGNPIVSLQRFDTKVVIPNLHASASGSVVGGAGGGGDVISDGLDSFSDILSVTQAQVDADQAENGQENSIIFVKLQYSIVGAIAALNGTAGADFDASISTLNGSEPLASVGGSATEEPNGDTSDNLLGKTFTLKFDISPSAPVIFQAELDAAGEASAPFVPITSSYIANLSDTAQFLGVSFYADAADTIPLPDIQLGSALGFDYIPSDAILSPAGATAAPEASTWAMMLLGFGGLGAIGFRRAALGSRT